MSHDELIEELAREHRYRNVMVAAAVVGVIASAVVAIVLAFGSSERVGVERGTLGMFALPFAVSMVIGAGVQKALVARGRRPKRAR